jgi:hypothetical protein
VSLLRQLFDRLHLWNKPHAIVFPNVHKHRFGKGPTTIQLRVQASRTAWIQRLRTRLLHIGHQPIQFSGHGFRAGGATDLFDAGIPLTSIMEFGRWRTAESALRYWRKTNSVALEVAMAFRSMGTKRDVALYLGEALWELNSQNYLPLTSGGCTNCGNLSVWKQRGVCGPILRRRRSGSLTAKTTCRLSAVDVLTVAT